ncbi:hypothetical protein [Sphingobacterium siyangense]|uniref:hypothetical protein n=1 Tax=Sphingobacterium siyangense TaxID=459529 RepID=UPI003DA6312B
MDKLECFNIDFATSAEKKLNDIIVFLEKNKNGFYFQKVIEGANQYSDLANYYLEASFICESVAKYGHVSDYKIRKINYHRPVAQFRIESFDVSLLSQYLHQLVLALQYEDLEECEIDLIDLLESYRLVIQKEVLQFPQLADDYLANLINGAYYEEESNFENPKEFLDHMMKYDPDHIFGFWRCSFSGKIKQEFYVSTESWIIPPQSDLKTILSQHSRIKLTKRTFDKGGFFSLNGAYYVVSERYVFRISFESLMKAFQCISHVFEDERNFSDHHNWLTHFNSNLKVKVSDHFSLVLFYFRGYKVLLWDCYKLNFNEISQINNSASQILFTTGNLIGLTANVECDWTILNDESFEELCYDLIYYDSRFDRRTIRKMGKSRSRDGGRDIVVHTESRLGSRPKKFIFQCKFIKNGNSLSASKVLDVSDTIDQYNADGYGVFTTGVIDATLFDKVDAIAQRRGLDVIFNSKYEIERELAILPELKSRYFKQLSNG